MTSEIREHLDEAYRHLQTALRLSVENLQSDGNAKHLIGQTWEAFLAKFFQAIRAASRESKVNLLSLISATKLWR